MENAPFSFASVLLGKPKSGSHGNLSTHNRCTAPKAILLGVQVHRSTFALLSTVLLAKQFCKNTRRSIATDIVEAMAAVRADEVVVLCDGGLNAGGDSLL